MPIQKVVKAAGDIGFPIKIWTDEVEESALKQLHNMSQLPFIHKWIACMPDVHMGYGATIGSVIPCHKAIIPSAVGVDIGCGMIAVKTTLIANDLPDNLAPIRSAIEEAVPHGRTANGKPQSDKGGWLSNVPDHILIAMGELNDGRWRQMRELYPDIIGPNTNVTNHLGTLGTGNHFIEVCLDESDNVWVMLHSGSRGIGNRIGSYFIAKAKKDMEKYFITLPDKDLAYLPEGSEHFNGYINAVQWAQDFARVNRELMMNATVKAVSDVLGRNITGDGHSPAINCHHNYVARENHYGQNVLVTRKGAIRARKGDLGIIPGSMGARSFIVEGKGNPESFHSCSHGAGRIMSRTEARKRYTAEDLAKATQGIECRKDEAVVDEIPMAYKDIDEVMANQSDLVSIKHTLHQIVNVKG